MSQITNPLLILCPDIAAYELVISSLANKAAALQFVPVLANDAKRLKGFPQNQPTLHFSEWTAPNYYEEALFGSNENRVCAVLGEEPSCMLAARYLCLATGKTLVNCRNGTDWTATLRRLVLDKNLTSLTLIFPSWRDAKLEPGQLVEVLNFMRQPDLLPFTSSLSYGIITGTQPEVIAMQVAKAVLQPSIIKAYQASTTRVITTYYQENLNTPIPRFEEESGQTPLQLFDYQSYQEGKTWQNLKQPFEAILFKGHGRNYCALDGLLCGARHLAENPFSSVKSCVIGMQCADPSFPQLDPRQFNTPVMVMDSCGTGNWAAYAWETGIPSLAFYAIAGAPSAVITEDAVTINSAIDYLDSLWALQTADTLGNATVRFNHIRRSENAIPPYFLMGDPDIPAGAARWSGWAYEFSNLQPLPSRHPGGFSWVAGLPPLQEPFVRIQFPPHPGDNLLTFAWSPQKEVEVNSCRFYQFGEEAEAWVTFNAPLGANTMLILERIPCPSLPKGLLEAATQLPLTFTSWKSPLEEAKLPLLQAAETIIETARLLDKIKGGALASSPEHLQSMLRQAQLEWISAHASAVQVMLKSAPKSLWPFSLWEAYNYMPEQVATPCPHCGLAPTIVRTYQSGPVSGQVRQEIECKRCDIVQDLPLVQGYPQLNMPVPQVIRPGSAIIELEIDNSLGEVDCLGAGAILMDRSGHGVTANPEIFTALVARGNSFKTQVTLTLDGNPPISHQYRVRALLLLNGNWFWLSRTVRVYGVEEPESGGI
ncbi:MAG: hypothetical protein HXX08_00715 [Chloroflexi bacterium]|uniref:Uncharacterized protein n=1 Tax=Candidatus Chlorohelix allophototropha TaxID=3003348 RepID=A0A8T7LU52_9CHLR|nr:hypothetical protein [Chloroflexota bacterium]WJW66270.1 hypothetical protein OZ401_002062 [Chloroflexota bacterium L227-S17]